MKSTTHHALAWRLVWEDPKGFLIWTKFSGASSHFRFDLFYIVDFHSAHSQPGHMRAEWKSTIWNRSKRKWLEAPLNFVEIKNPFGFFQTNPQANAWWVVLFILSKKCKTCARKRGRSEWIVSTDKDRPKSFPCNTCSGLSPSWIEFFLYDAFF